jgi:hypothetical protein
MNRRRLPGASARRRFAVGLVLGLAPSIAAACAAQTRCTHDTDCDEGQICSNAKDPLGDGVCVGTCDPRVGAQTPCAEAGAPHDGGSDAHPDANRGDAGSRDAAADGEAHR